MPKPVTLAALSERLAVIEADLKAVRELSEDFRRLCETRDQPDPDPPSKRRYRLDPSRGESFHIEGDANLAGVLGLKRSGLSARMSQAKALGRKSFTVKVVNHSGSAFFDQRAYSEGLLKLRVTVTRVEA